MSRCRLPAGRGAERLARFRREVEGKSLDRTLTPEGLPVEEALAICVQLAQALVAAHKKGIVHRDLTPANITIRPDEAVDALLRSVDDGWRLMSRRDTELNRNFDSLRRELEFQALRGEIEAHLDAQVAAFEESPY